MPRSPRTGKRPLSVAEKQLCALTQRSIGMTLARCAELCGYETPAGAQKAVVKALEEQVKAPLEAVRELELERLDRLLMSWMPQALALDVDGLNAVLRIMDRRAKFQGLDAPVKREISMEVMLRDAAEKMADHLDLDVNEVVAEAEALIASIQDQ